MGSDQSRPLRLLFRPKRCSKSRPLKKGRIVNRISPNDEVSLLPSGEPQTAFLRGANVDNAGGILINNAGRGGVRVSNRSSKFEMDIQRARGALQALVVVNAMHTGEVREEPPRCHPDTRLAIISNIISWIQDPHRAKNVLWLFGPAGIGKSAIATSVGERLDRRGSTAKVAGSFFFFSTDFQRNNLRNFVATIAYRLAVCIEGVGREIDKAIAKDPKILEATVEIQWKTLIVNTVRIVRKVPRAVIIIDGLDECEGTKDQLKVLNLISSCGPDFPLAFLVSSRPEPHLVNFFKFKDSQEMRRFIRHGFSSIYNKHHDLLHPHLKDGVWPSDRDVDFITSRADGQFIYPVTLFKFIDNDDADPHDQL